MHLRELMSRHGGLATRAALVGETSPRTVDRALADGVLVRAGRGRYTLPEVDGAAAVAHGMNGLLCLTSAALYHGWQVWRVPELPQVVVPRRRKVPARFREAVDLHRRDVVPTERDGVATSRALTLEQCLRLLPADEGLAIADSALRSGGQDTLRQVAASVTGPGAAKVRSVAARASKQAANPFESALRAICDDVPGLSVEPQVTISSPHVWARPDLVDRARRLVVEAESFEWHGSRAGLRKDVRRYSLLVADGWLVLRFIWEDVMVRPGWVHAVLRRSVALDDARTQLIRTGPFAA